MGGHEKPVPDPVSTTLADLGINKKVPSLAQQLALLRSGHPSLGLQQDGEPSPSGAGQLGERYERHVELAPFEPRDVGPIHPGSMCEGFL